MGKLLERIRKRKSKKHKSKLYIKRTTPKRLLNAIRGSGGIIKIIAERLGVTYATAYGALTKAPEYVKQELTLENERVADIAEQTVAEMMAQRLDFGTASRTARWLLERKHGKRGYTPTREVTVQGGKNPLKLQTQNLVSLETLKTIPIDVRKKMLKEIEKKGGNGK